MVGHRWMMNIFALILVSGRVRHCRPPARSPMQPSADWAANNMSILEACSLKVSEKSIYALTLAFLLSAVAHMMLIYHASVRLFPELCVAYIFITIISACQIGAK